MSSAPIPEPCWGNALANSGTRYNLLLKLTLYTDCNALTLHTDAQGDTTVTGAPSSHGSSLISLIDCLFMQPACLASGRQQPHLVLRVAVANLQRHKWHLPEALWHGRQQRCCGRQLAAGRSCRQLLTSACMPCMVQIGLDWIGLKFQNMKHMA